MNIAPGTRVRRYEVTSAIGAGGMGEVWLARDVELERTVALKILPRDAASSPELVRRFVQEAKAACALNHPNVAHIYEIGDESGVRFISMEYVEGDTLRTRLGHGRMPVSEAIEVATQIAAALASAHTAGVVHRDIKPENVMIRPDGYVKVLDFGLAKLLARPEAEAGTARQTAPGIVMGTMQYMAPEQLRGDSVDARADVFSLGVVLAEMVTGHRPFTGDSSASIIAKILTEPPDVSGAPPELLPILQKALAKKREERFASAREVHEALRGVAGTARIRSGDLPTQVLTESMTARPRRWRYAAVVGALVVLAAIAWGAMRWNRIREARASIPRVEQLAEQQKWFDAYDLGQSVRAVTGADARLDATLAKICDDLTVETTPPGARVWLTRLGAETRTLAGTTPLRKLAIPHGEYVLTIEKEGFATVNRPLSTTPVQMYGFNPQVLEPFRLTLPRASEVPAGMVRVEGGASRLNASDRPTNRAVTLQPFFIDAYEVSNAEFAKFVLDNGYRRPELWDAALVAGGFEKAIARFHDTTGLAGPRNWAGQKWRPGQERHPVSGVTWYEADAYARWAGKRLPTIFEWDHAARRSRSWVGNTFPWGIETGPRDVNTRANFRGAGTLPVDALPFGLSPYGAYNMAGNVAEWCANVYDTGHAMTGGSYDDATYTFLQIGTRPALYASDTLGFRCVKELALAPARGDQGGFALLSPNEVPVLHPVSDAEYAKIVQRYAYAAAPLNARVLERQQQEAWTREKVTFTGADGKTALAYLYLPKSAKPPYQVLQFIPAADVARGLRRLDEAIEAALAPEIRNGRAVFGVVLEGYLERPMPASFRMPPGTSEEFVDGMVADVTDERRGLDYLASRGDADMSRIALFGPSAGSALGMIVAAVENRYRSLFFMGSGLSSTPLAPAANRMNFLPHIKTPKMLLQGRYDESHALRTEVEPMVKLLAEPKRFVLYEGGHTAPPEVMIPALRKWLDETLGPVGVTAP